MKVAFCLALGIGKTLNATGTLCAREHSAICIKEVFLHVHALLLRKEEMRTKEKPVNLLTINWEFAPIDEVTDWLTSNFKVDLPDDMIETALNPKYIDTSRVLDLSRRIRALARTISDSPRLQERLKR